MKKILLIEDDAHVCSFVKKGLSEEGYSVTVAMDGLLGLELIEKEHFDLILLDIMLPSISGLEVCKRIRKNNDIPIIMLTALGTAENVALGLDTGADDYLVKPFKFIELLARIKSLLRRAENKMDTTNKNVVTFSDLRIDDDAKEVFRNDALITLTSTEYRLLLMFVTNAKRVLSRVEILDEVWGVDFDLGTNVVDVYVNYLRKKLDKHGDRKLIHTVIGMGYVLKEE